MGIVIGAFTIMFESVCILSLILTMTAVLCDKGTKEIELIPIKRNSRWLKVKSYRPGYCLGEHLRCAKCGCEYHPTKEIEGSVYILGPSPKYCPECGKRMINWKEINV